MVNEPQIDDAFVSRIALLVACDARSVIRRLAGLPVRGLLGARIDRAIAAQRAALRAERVQESDP